MKSEPWRNSGISRYYNVRSLVKVGFTSKTSFLSMKLRFKLGKMLNLEELVVKKNVRESKSAQIF